jgi:hypothetical protein
LGDEGESFCDEESDDAACRYLSKQIFATGVGFKSFFSGGGGLEALFLSPTFSLLTDDGGVMVTAALTGATAVSLVCSGCDVAAVLLYSIWEGGF